MNDHDPSAIRKPRADDRVLWDIIMGIYGYQAVLLAHDLKLFPLLAKKPLTLLEISDMLHISLRPAQALVSVCISLDLITSVNDRYSLTPLSEDYFLESSPTYFGSFLDVSISTMVLTFEKLKHAVLTNTSQVYEGEDIYAYNEGQTERAGAFTSMMHSHSMAAALAWPDKLDLSRCRVMLDVGGGSGAHSIGAALKFPELRAVVLDLAPVCAVAEEFIAGSGLKERITVHAANMWSDPFPQADLHFYSDIFHDFTFEKCRFLTQKSFSSLLSGGRIIIHEMLYNKEKTGPFTVAGYNISMLLWTEGQQFSGSELSDMLQQAGFTDIAVIPTFGYWHVVTGRKQ